MNLRLVPLLALLTLSQCSAAWGQELEELLDSLRGRRVGKVSLALAQEAVEAIPGDVTRNRLEQLVRVAKAGGLDREAAQALMGRYVDLEGEAASLLQLRQLDPSAVYEAALASNEWYDALWELEPKPRFVAEYLAVYADEARVLAVLGRWDDRLSAKELARFLRSLAQNPRPLPALRALLQEESELPSEVFSAAEFAVQHLARDVDCADLLLGRFRAGNASRLSMFGLGYVPFQRLPQARALIHEALLGTNDEVLSLASTCAANLRMASAFPRVLEVAQFGAEAQAPALRALPVLARLNPEGRAERERVVQEVASDVARQGPGATLEESLLLASALECLAELSVRDVVPPETLIAWALDPELPSELRRAAMSSLPGGAGLRGESLQALIELLDDTALSAAALKNLTRLVGFRFPPAPGVWKAWLNREIAAGRIERLAPAASVAAEPASMAGPVAVNTQPPADSSERGPEVPLGYLLLGLLAGLGCAYGFAWSRQRRAPERVPFKLPSVSQALNEERGRLAEGRPTATRLERLQAELEVRRVHERPAPEQGDLGILGALQGALWDMPEPSPATSALGPELLDSVEELLAVHAALDRETWDFDVWVARLSEVESVLGGALQDVQEYTFLLSQLAHCRSHGLPLSEEARVRCVEIKSSLEEQVQRRAPRETLDADVVFGEEGGQTLDADQVFAEESLIPRDETIDAEAFFAEPEDRAEG